jgi:lysyl-tRNA synthetase class 2
VNRDDFLKNFWKAYPQAPANADVFGRISHLESSQISIQLKGEWSFSKDLKFPVSVLQKNDWVALHLSKGQVRELTLLAPALEPPLELSSSLVRQKQWFHFLAQVRLFFSGKAFSEAQTPTLVTCPGTEPFLDLFSTEFVHGKIRKKLYLPTSPELHLKKILSAGAENIFEIRPCFRNGEISERHQPEFWMLEWYRSFVDLNQILQDSLHLIEFLGGSVEGFQRKTMAQLFKEKLNFELTPQTSLEELKKLATANDLRVEHFNLWDDVFYFIFIEKIEPFLDSEQPLFVEKYPPSQAALARLTEDGWGDRFELYWKGFEIANAFNELNDPEIQKLRFEQDLQLKKTLGREVPPLDLEFMQALKSGLPPSAGIALGLERLFMALHNLQDIRELRPFAFRI